MPTLTIPRTLVTAAEFARMPNPRDGSRQELVRGEVITMPPTAHPHGYVQIKVGKVLDNYLDDNAIGHLTGNSGIVTETDPDTVRGPDVAFWSSERLPLGFITKGYTEVPPDLCVEILSPGNRPRKMREKIAEYFAHGVRLVWLIDPDMRTVTVYSSADEGRTLWEDAELSGEDVLPGFRCKIAKLLPPPPAALPPEPPVNGAQ